MFLEILAAIALGVTAGTFTGIYDVSGTSDRAVALVTTSDRELRPYAAERLTGSNLVYAGGETLVRLGMVEYMCHPFIDPVLLNGTAESSTGSLRRVDIVVDTHLLARDEPHFFNVYSHRGRAINHREKLGFLTMTPATYIQVMERLGRREDSVGSADISVPQSR